MKTIVDYYIEYNHPENPGIWHRTYDYYASTAQAYNRIQQFKTMDYMREMQCRMVERTQTFKPVA